MLEALWQTARYFKIEKVLLVLLVLNIYNDVNIYIVWKKLTEKTEEFS